MAPDVRLGQLFANFGFLGEAHLDKGMGYLDDDEMLAILYRHRTELAARSRGGPDASSLCPEAGVSVSGGPLGSTAG